MKFLETVWTDGNSRDSGHAEWLNSFKIRKDQRGINLVQERNDSNDVWHLLHSQPRGIRVTWGQKKLKALYAYHALIIGFNYNKRKLFTVSFPLVFCLYHIIRTRLNTRSTAPNRIFSDLDWVNLFVKCWILSIVFCFVLSLSLKKRLERDVGITSRLFAVFGDLLPVLHMYILGEMLPFRFF